MKTGNTGVDRVVGLLLSQLTCRPGG